MGHYNRYLNDYKGISYGILCPVSVISSQDRR